MGVVIRQSIKATMVSYVGAALGAILVIYVYPKALNPETIGLLRVLTEASLFFSAFAMLGMSSFAIKFFPYFKSEINNNGFAFYIFIVPILGFILYLLVSLFNKELIVSLFAEKSPLLNQYLIYIIPLTLFWMYITLSETYTSLLQRIVFPRIIKDIGIRIFTILIIALFFFKIITISQLVFLFVCIYGIATFLCLYYLNSLQPINLKPDFKIIKKPLRNEMLYFTLFMIVVTLGSNISSKIDVFMLSQKVSLTGTGIFTIAFFIASFIEMPSRAIFQITTPFVSDALKRNDMKVVDYLYKRVAINQLIVAGFIFLIIWVNVDNIFKIMPNGHLYESGKYVILFIGLAKVFDAATGINTSILGNSKFYYYILFFIFILAALTVYFNLKLIPEYGIVGSAMATALAIFIYNTLMVAIVWFKLKIQPFTTKTITCIIVLIAILAINWLFPINNNPLIDIAFRSILLFLIFLFVIVKLRISEDFNRIVKDLFNKIVKTKI